MNLWDYIMHGVKNENEKTEETPTPQVHKVDVKDCNATWHTAGENHMWQLQYAFIVVQGILANLLSCVDWKTYSRGKVVKGEEWFRFNVSPNNRETAVEFYSKLATKLVYEGEALIIETAKKELFVADSYSYKNGKRLLMKDNTFINVVIGDVMLNRTFKENDSCMFIVTPNFNNVLDVFTAMGKDFLELKDLIMEGAQKALGMKLALNLASQAKNKYDSEYLNKIQEAYRPLMKARDGVFVTYKGESLTDLTEKQRGSEVQQVLDAVDNDIKVNQEILCNVGSAFGIPRKFMTGDFTADNDSLYSMLMTMFGKRYLTLLSQKFTFFALTKEDIIAGGKIEANLNSIKFVEKLSMATAIDKLIGSGAYNRNEVREMLDDDPVENGDIYFITKNYAELEQYVKGGSNTT